MHTLRKLPMRRPKRSATRASIMELPDHVRQAGSPLMGTLLVRHHVIPATRVETSLDTAGTSACATCGSRLADLRRAAENRWRVLDDVFQAPGGLFRRQGRGPCRSLFENDAAQGLPGGRLRGPWSRTRKRSPRRRRGAPVHAPSRRESPGRGSWLYLATPYGSGVSVS